MVSFKLVVRGKTVAQGTRAEVFQRQQQVREFRNQGRIVQISETQDRVDVIDRENNQFVARNVTKFEAEQLRRGSPSFTIAPAGSIQQPAFSFSPDIGRGPPVTTETDPRTGAIIPINSGFNAI